MKKIYSIPTAEILEFDAKDIITTSGVSESESSSLEIEEGGGIIPPWF